jgi:predicted nucleic acid-binding protein
VSVCIDAMVLIWGFQKPHYQKKGKPRNQDVAEMRRRARLLLTTLAEDNETVMVPAIAVSEVLIGIRPEEHGEFIATLQEHFFLPPYDLRAASLAAKLWQQTRELPKAEQPVRATLRSDVMIVATAKVAQAHTVYSHDERLRKLAIRAGLQSYDLPMQSPNIFINEEIRRQAEEE